MKPFWATLLLVLSAPLALAEETTADQAVGAANTAWIMTATALVLFMTLPGLALFYGGLVHKKNVLSVLMHCFAMACILSVVWLVAGYSLALEGTGQKSKAGRIMGRMVKAFSYRTGSITFTVGH